MTDVAMEEDEFNALMLRHNAAFSDIITRYAKHLVKSEREYLQNKAVEIAWENRQHIGPQINLWWDTCCRMAADSRPTWTIVTFAGVQVVRSKRLGR